MLGAPRVVGRVTGRDPSGGAVPMTKFVRLTLALVLLVTGLTATTPLPQVALATTPSCPDAVEPAGAGTAADPYRIATRGHLMWLSATSGVWDKSFIQVDDIDFEGTLAVAGCPGGWSPIGTSSTPFTGVYDGQGHSITKLFIDRPTTPGHVGVGFFGRTIGAEIRHLHLIDVDITGSHEVGALIGTNRRGSVTVVYDVSATGDVESARTGSNIAADVGGLFGYLYDIDITFARAEVNVSAIGRNVGGLVGDGTSGTSISRSWATGSVTSTGDQGQVGGLAGLFRGIGIYDSYATGDVTRGDVTRGVDEETSMPVLVRESGVGGLVGRLGSIATELHRSYATGDVSGPACPDRCGFSVGDDADGRPPSKDVHLPTGSSETAIRLAAADWERTVIWTLPAAEGLPTLRTPPGRPVVTDLTRDAGEVRVTVGSLDTTGFETNPLEVSKYQESNTVKRLHLEDNGFEDESDDAIEGSFAVEFDPTSSGPTVLRVRARSGDVFGPAVSFWRPTAPRSLTADTIAPDSIDLSWAAPADEGTATGVTVPPTTYVVEFGPSGTLAAQPETTATTASLTGLDGATEYTTRVSARNVIGVGAASEITTLTVPAAPTILAERGLVAGDGEVRVRWDQPPGGSEIDGYTVTASPGGETCTTTPPTRECIVSGLTNGTEYTFTVAAENSSGTGPASTAAGPVTPNEVLVAAPPCADLPASDPEHCDGSVDRPYLIATADNLRWVAVITNGGSSNGSIGKHFEQIADIDLFGVSNWTPIGNNSRPFGGTYDGRFHSIRDLKVRDSSTVTDRRHGLFGRANNATIRNLKLEDVDIAIVQDGTSETRIGALAGEITGTTAVLRVSVTTRPGAAVQYDAGSSTIQTLYLGGVVGQSNNTARLADQISFRGDIRILNSQSLRRSSLTSGSSFLNVGGILGRTSSQSTLSLAYSQARITVERTGTTTSPLNLRIGTALGSSSGGDSTVTEMYSTGELINPSGMDGIAFGVFGEVGSSGDEVIEVFHPDTLDPFGVAASSSWAGGAGFRALETSLMQGASASGVMTGAPDSGRWDFETVWTTVTDPDDFPIFRWETVQAGTTAPSAPRNVTVTIPATTATVSWLAPADDGGDPVITYTVTADPADGAGSCTTTALTCQIAGLELDESYTFTVVPSNAAGPGPSATSAPAVAGFVPPTPLPPPLAPAAPPTPVAPPLPTAPVPTAGGTPPAPTPAPTARVGEVEVPVAATPAGTVRIEGTTTVSTATILEVGRVALALDVTDAGEVRAAPGEAPQVSVVRGTTARTSGSGMLPDTELAVWLPRDGSDVRRVTTLAVAADGTFTGALPFDGSGDAATDGRPLPIGRQVLQLVGVDADGQLLVIEQTVTIAQPAPSPEPDRSAGAPPALTPGASIATNAGLPEAVTVVPLPDVRQARVEGSGWAMAVDVPSAEGRVAPTDDGGALIELVADDVAEVSGDGFLPGTRADVWLFSTPTLLGSVTIGPDGTFTGAVGIDGERIAVGEHTLQLQGVGRDGYVRAANLGVVVVPAESGAPDEPAAQDPEPESAPEPAPAGPDGTVEVVTAAAQDPAGTSPLLWLALLAALGAAVWWSRTSSRRRDAAAHHG